MAHEALTVGPMTSGALVAPFPVRATTGLSLHILTPDRMPTRTIQIVDWLIEHEQHHAS